jgi:hypothetical protein
LLTWAPRVFAQTNGRTVEPPPDLSSWDITNVFDIIDTITNWLFTILLVLAVIFIILAAYKYLTSRGESAQVSEAHKQVIYAAVAIAVALLSKAVEGVVRSLLDVGAA